LAQTRDVLPGSNPTRSRQVVIALAITAAVAYSWVAGHFATFTRPAEVVTFVPGLVGVVIAARIAPSSAGRPDRSARGWLAWWLIVIAITAIELAALALGANHAHPTISDLVNPGLLSTPSRALAFGLWLAFGCWLLRR
jgi:hypothetical protein